jgi:hypothetical protein
MGVDTGNDIVLNFVLYRNAWQTISNRIKRLQHRV